MISVLDDSQRELRAAVLAMKAASRDLKRDINRRTRETMNPVWKSLVAANVAGMKSPGSRMLGTGVRIKAGNPPQALAAQSRRPIGRTKRLTPAEHYYLWEFGVPSRGRYSTYDRRSRGGGTHKVKRRTMTGLPARDSSGRAVYPAFAEIGPRMVSLWVQTIVRTYYEAAEGKR